MGKWKSFPLLDHIFVLYINITKTSEDLNNSAKNH